MNGQYLQKGDAIDYTPVEALTAGTIVVVNDLIGVPACDIPAGEMGALQIVGVFSAAKGAELPFLFGNPVFWDTANKTVAAAAGEGIVRLGLCVADSPATSDVVRVHLNR